MQDKCVNIAAVPPCQHLQKGNDVLGRRGLTLGAHLLLCSQQPCTAELRFPSRDFSSSISSAIVGQKLDFLPWFCYFAWLHDLEQERRMTELLPPPPNTAAEDKAMQFCLGREMTLLQILLFQVSLMKNNCPGFKHPSPEIPPKGSHWHTKHSSLGQAPECTRETIKLWWLPFPHSINGRLNVRMNNLFKCGSRIRNP